MSSYGKASPYGKLAPWGATAGEDFACELTEDRVLVQHPDAPGERKFRDWLCQYGRQAGQYRDVARDVINGFKLETAIGAQLDLIGAMIGLPRSGYADARYRTLLEIQAELLLASNPDVPNWTGTSENILQITRQFIGVGPDPIVLINTPPYSFVLVIPGVTLSELDILIGFLCKAIFADVLGTIIIPFGDGVYCYEVLADTPDAGPYCYTVAADTVDAILYAHIILIGIEEC